MSQCHQIRRQFDDRLDGRLSAGQTGEFDAHLAGCEPCRQSWQAYAASWQTLGMLPSVEPSRGFVERTLRRLDEPAEAVGHVTWIPVWRWSWAAAAGVIVALGLGAWAGWYHLEVRQRARVEAAADLYAQVHETDFLEDFDVIASLDQLRLKENGH